MILDFGLFDFHADYEAELVKILKFRYVFTNMTTPG